MYFLINMYFFNGFMAYACLCLRCAVSVRHQTAGVTATNAVLVIVCPHRNHQQ